MKNKWKFIFVTVLLYNCQNNNFDYYFNNLVNIHTNQTFPSYGLLGIGNIKNKYYVKLYNMGKNINNNLLEKAYSNKVTNWYFNSFYFQMTEGDIAIELLLSINLKYDNDFCKIVPEEIKDEYIINSGNANIWWIYLHKSDENKAKIIELMKENIIK